MNPSRLFLAVAALALALMFTIAVSTSATAAATAPKPTPTPGPVDTKKLISAVNATASTVTIQYQSNKKTFVYKVDDFTTIRVNDSHAKLADIKVGMVVSESSERDAQTLESISLTTPTPTPTPPPKK